MHYNDKEFWWINTVCAKLLINAMKFEDKILIPIINFGFYNNVIWLTQTNKIQINHVL